MSTRTALHRSILFVAALLFAATAQAVVPVGLFRAYLASTGSDTNDCTRPTPCRLLPAALTAVADGGEIWMLDSANYNTATVSITKSVSILAVPGAVGSVVTAGGPAINIASAGVKVALRNLVIVPLAGSTSLLDGIDMFVASTLTIEDSLIANVLGAGVAVIGTGTAKIANTTLRNIGAYGVLAQDGANVSISGSRILSTYDGVFARASTATLTSVVVSDSIVSGAADVGLRVSAEIAGASVRIFVTRCTVEGAYYGLSSESSGGGQAALITLSSSMLTNNYIPFHIIGPASAIKSMGNNHIDDNTYAGVGTLTTVSLQ